MNSDLRSAWRSLWKTPVTAAGAILTLGLGIGGTTAIFGLFNAVLLRPLPYPDADRLIEISSTVQRQTIERRRSSFPDYFDWRDRTRSFDGIAAWDTMTRIVSGEREPVQVETEFVDGPFLDLLGARPVAGRLFEAADHRPDAAAVAIVNEAFWNEHLGRSPDILGRALRLDAAVYTIVGVVPDTFRGGSDEAVIWTPAATTVDKDRFAARGSRGLALLARLKPGVTREQAQADIHGVSAQLARDYPTANAGRSAQLRSLDQAVLGGLRPLVSLLFAVTLAVLLIACANVASLLLARGEARRREMSLRRALGSSESRLVRLLIAESALLVVGGLAVGTVLAQWTGTALLALSPVQLPSFALPQVDWRTVAFVALLGAVLFGIGPGDSVSFVGAMLVMMLAALAASLVPAIRTARMDPLAALRADR